MDQDFDINSEQGDTIAELACNIDDMTAEAIGFAMDELLAGGALDVFTQPIQMKKSRPGTLLTVLCHEADKNALVRLIFKHTTTLGVREYICARYTLKRRFDDVETSCGKVQKKTSYGYGTARAKYEYDDIAGVARANGLSLREVQDLVAKADKV